MKRLDAIEKRYEHWTNDPKFYDLVEKDVPWLVELVGEAEETMRLAAKGTQKNKLFTPLQRLHLLRRKAESWLKRADEPEGE